MTAPAPGALALPRASAVERLADALEHRGMPAVAAAAVARAAVSPDDLRRRLAAPVELRVPGGVMDVVETPVWAHGVVPYPTNPRELGRRVYPLGLDGDAPDEHRLIADPTAAGDGTCCLELRVASRAQLVTRLRDAEEWLTQDNPLAADVAADGVLQPLTLVPIAAVHDDGAPPAGLLAAADGSSRTAAAHLLLGLDAAAPAYELAASQRAFRAAVGKVLRRLDDADPDDVSDEDLAAYNALALPARIVVGYRPRHGRRVAMDAAVRSLIGLMHINPPKQYGRAVASAAVADAVLDALAQPLRTRGPAISGEQQRWYAATMTPREAEAAGLPAAPDVRAADVVRALLMGGRRTVGRVNAGIRSITAEARPPAEKRVDAAVELVLRPWLAARRLPPAQVQARRAALQRILRMPEIAEQRADELLEGLEDSPLDLDGLRDAAVREARARGGDGLSAEQVELGVKAAYYMALADPMALRREQVGRRDDADDGDDNRALSVVVRAMVSSPRGCRQAHAVVVAGRAGRPLAATDPAGRVLRDAAGGPVVLTDRLVRSTYGGAPGRRSATTGAAAARARWTDVEGSVDGLDSAVAALLAVTSSAGRPLVLEQGWPSGQVAPVLLRLGRLERALGALSDVWDERNAEEPDEDEDDEDGAGAAGTAGPEGGKRAPGR